MTAEPRFAYVSPFVPAEWIAAHGGRPLRLRPRRELPFRHVLPGVCPFARATLATCESRDDVDAIVLTTTCDQMRRAAEHAAESVDVPVFLFNVPATWQTAQAFRLYLDELGRLGRFIVAHGGREPVAGALAGHMRRWDAFRARVLARAARVGPRAFDLLFGDVDVEAEVPGPGPAGESARTGVPVALVGGPLAAEDMAVFDAIESAGGIVVLDGTESGARGLPAPLDRRLVDDDPQMALAEAYFGSIPDAFRRPDTALYDWIGREFRVRARGVVIVRYVWCDMWAAHEERLREAIGLPVLSLDLDGEDGAIGRLAGRVEAFMEMLQ